VDLARQNTEGHFVGLEIGNIEYFDRKPPSSTGRDSDYPIRSIKAEIRHRATIVIKYVDPRPQTPDVVESEAWSNSLTEAEVSWGVVMPPDPDVEYIYALYAVGTSSYTQDKTQGWLSTVHPVFSYRATGLSMRHGEEIYYQVKAVSRIKTTGEVKEGPPKFAVIKIDITPPSAPKKVIPAPSEKKVPEPSGRYVVRWEQARDPTEEEENIARKENRPVMGSGIELYEIQERVDNSPIWKTIDVVPGNVLQITVGDGQARDINGKEIEDKPREPGHFYYYRVRAKNTAGTWGPWSPPSPPASTGLPEEIISEAFSYPNPVDMRQPGAQTYITYVLREDAKVTISIYDLLGYLVRQWVCEAGQEGGKAGSNTIPWDGTNEAGEKVAKGGYIAYIVAESASGRVTKVIKIGVIH
jgi:hypothetical protein